LQTKDLASSEGENELASKRQRTPIEAKKSGQKPTLCAALNSKRGLSMCLAVPGKILETKEENGTRLGRVQFGGITRLVQLDFVPEAGVGDYVIVHVGFALSKVNAEEAQRTYQMLEEMGMLVGEEAQDSG
jgi:hydrogenase expression/formation protein HypC